MRRFEAHTAEQLDEILAKVERRIEYHSDCWQRWSDYLAEIQAEKIMRENS